MLVTAAAIIVLGLAAYAGWLHYQLWQLKKRRHPPVKGIETFEPAVANKHYIGPRKSLYVLADALLSDNMTATEGCLRICAVASNLEDSENFRREFGVLFRVAEATAHFPILDDWQLLSKDRQLQLTKERIAIEDKYRDAIIEAAERIRMTMG